MEDELEELGEAEPVLPAHGEAGDGAALQLRLLQAGGAGGRAGLASPRLFQCPILGCAPCVGPWACWLTGTPVRRTYVVSKLSPEPKNQITGNKSGVQRT